MNAYMISIIFFGFCVVAGLAALIVTLYLLVKKYPIRGALLSGFLSARFAFLAVNQNAAIEILFGDARLTMRNQAGSVQDTMAEHFQLVQERLQALAASLPNKQTTPIKTTNSLRITLTTLEAQDLQNDREGDEIRVKLISHIGGRIQQSEKAVFFKARGTIELNLSQDIGFAAVADAEAKVQMWTSFDPPLPFMRSYDVQFGPTLPIDLRAGVRKSATFQYRGKLTTKRYLLTYRVEEVPSA